MAEWWQAFQRPSAPPKGAGTAAPVVLNPIQQRAQQVLDFLMGGLLGAGDEEVRRRDPAAWGELVMAAAPFMGAIKAVKGAQAGKAAALDLSEAARMQRAAEQGFTVDAYHGTGRDITAFSHDAPKVTGGGLNDRTFAFSADPKVADRYATDFHDRSVVYPVKLKVQKPLEMSASQFERLQDFMYARREGQPVSEVKQVWLEEELKKLTGTQPPEGIADPVAWLREHGYDGIVKRGAAAGAEPEVLVFEPQQIRSRFAKFDPRKASSGNILAGLMTPIVAGAVVQNQRPQ